VGFKRYALFCVLAAFVCLPAVAQQTDINRYTIYTGFDYMLSPARNLTQRGFDVDFGVTAKPWLGPGAEHGWARHSRRLQLDSRSLQGN
jgi:hypothetical protein